MHVSTLFRCPLYLLHYLVIISKLLYKGRVPQSSEGKPMEICDRCGLYTIKEDEYPVHLRACAHCEAMICNRECCGEERDDVFQCTGCWDESDRLVSALCSSVIMAAA